MIDLRLLRDDPELFRTSQAARGEDPNLVDALLEADELRRTTGARFDTLRNEQKLLGKQVAKASAEDRPALLARAKELADEVKAADAQRAEATQSADGLTLAISNLVSPHSPQGGEDDFTLLEERGTVRDFTSEGVTVRDHLEIGELLGAIDVERGAKVSGSRFYYLTGVGALLELALINLAMSQATANGLTPIIPPALVKPFAMEGTGFLGQAEENVYRLDADDMYLVGTAEVPLAAYHAEEILPADTLPRRFAGYSPSYRREAGSHGKDTRGIFRVHWFDKVEMFTFTSPEDAEAEHALLLAYEKQFLDSLELPYRVIDVATGDLGASAVRKFDCEAWIPSQGRYRELTSTSNCTTFQSRRLRVRERSADGTVRPLATLNGTLVAIPRTIIALLENHQQADGSVRVPAALQPFLGGRTALEPLA
ncbi:MAG: serine--tRNA ligase [Actinomycetota bacterium]|nr:serine--tRNA ligase [Actinomycetota bacterium]